MFLLLSFLLSGCYPLPGYYFCPGPYGPDEAQQFTSNCGGDLSFVLACCSRSHVTLVQPVLCLPRNLFGLFRNTLLPFAQSVAMPCTEAPRTSFVCWLEFDMTILSSLNNSRDDKCVCISVPYREPFALRPVAPAFMVIDVSGSDRAPPFPTKMPPPEKHHGD